MGIVYIYGYQYRLAISVLINTVINTIWCEKIWCEELLKISSYFITAEL